MSRECPLIPMGAITGRPTREQLGRRLAQFRELGITQFLIYPRSGCELEYMSDEWLDTCEWLIEEAETLGFTSLWLYDEFNWPSGQCGGRIQAASPDFALQTLEISSDGDGGRSFSIGRYERFPNLLNPEAMELFLSLTHEKYAARLGRFFGRLIKGIFTDEPAPGYADDYGDGDGGGVLKLAYYPELEEDYRKKFGRPLRSDVGTPGFFERYHLLIGERFRRVFFDRIREWCTRHDLLLTGHLMGEDSVGGSHRFSGQPLLAISGFSLPGLDEICTRTTIDTAEWLTLGTARFGVEARGNGGLAELFALGPGDLPLAKQRQMISLASLFGINHYVLAVSQLDSRGNIGKPGWYNPYSPDQPWFVSLGQLGEDAKIAADLAERKAAPEIAVRYPNGEKEICDLLRALVRAQRPWRLAAWEEEVSGAIEVIRPEPGGYRLERSGRSAGTPAGMVALLDELLPRRAVVENPDGSLAGDLMLKLYADGSAVVLDLTDAPTGRRLCFRCGGRSVDFMLPGRGRVIFERWRVERDRPNLLRPEWRDGVWEFTVESPVTVIPALRTYGSAAGLRLDGRPVETVASRAEMLPEGFRELYAAGAPVALAAGEHRLELISPVPDYAYLPPVWLTGDFGFSLPDRLAPDRLDGCGLDEYTGTLTQTGMLDVPPDAAGFDLECDELATSVSFDGEALGQRLWPPFFWSVPERFRGRRVLCRIVRHTSVGPAFGDLSGGGRISEAWARGFEPGRFRLRHPVVEPRFRLF